MPKVLAEPSASELEVKRSTFLGIAVPVSSQGELREVRSRISQLHREATHVAWACRLMAGERVEELCSDGGEPPGSAGRPLLAALRRRDLVNSAVFVVRRFGGVKLGLEGLSEAYYLAASRALERAKLEELRRKIKVRLLVPYGFAGYAEERVRSCGARVTSRAEGEEGLELEATVEEERFAPLEEMLRRWLEEGELLSLSWEEA